MPVEQSPACERPACERQRDFREDVTRALGPSERAVSVGFRKTLAAPILATSCGLLLLTAAQHMQPCCLPQSSRGAVLSLQRAGWATLAPATASSAWRSPRSTFGAWTTRAASSAAPCQAPGCAGRSLKMPSSRWQSRPQVRPHLSPGPRGLCPFNRLAFSHRCEGFSPNRNCFIWYQLNSVNECSV